MTRGPVIIAGSLAQRPGVGGHAWVFLQWLLGLRKLGWDVLFLDWFDAAMCRDRAGNACAASDSWNLSYIADVMRMHGLGVAWSLDFNNGEQTFGRPRAEVLAAAQRSPLLINVMGFLHDREILERPAKRAFLDIDPGFGQMWQELGLAVLFNSHDAHVTIGENIGRAGCTIPLCGLDWITTPQPVVLDRWRADPPPAGAPFTSVVSWRGPFGPVEYAGKTYGLRVHEFRKFVSLPRLTGRQFEVALSIDLSDAKDIALLRENGWQITDPLAAACTPDDYRAFIHRSAAELMIAKSMYVESGSGWLSDRSLCYLASGRPVLAQDTGFTQNYAAGEGLLAFRTLHEACQGVEEIGRNYAAHSRAALAVAERHFDSDKVLARLLDILL